MHVLNPNSGQDKKMEALILHALYWHDCMPTAHVIVPMVYQMAFTFVFPHMLPLVLSMCKISCVRLDFPLTSICVLRVLVCPVRLTQTVYPPPILPR